MDDLAAALQDAGGVEAPRERSARLRDLLLKELDHGAQELGRKRSGYEHPVTVAFAQTRQVLHAAVPVPVSVRADASELEDRAWPLVAAAVGALAEVADLPTPSTSEQLALTTADLNGHLLLALPAREQEGAELAACAFDDQLGKVDRLKARALALPGHVLDGAGKDMRPPIDTGLRVFEAVARLGGRPADPAAADANEDAVMALLGLSGDAVRPHADPDPAKRVARRILQRLNGMGKWGGYHTEFTHVARGFRGNDRALAELVAERLLDSGLLAEKPSVGQRHVFLNPGRAGDIHALIDTGATPPDLKLP